MSNIESAPIPTDGNHPPGNELVSPEAAFPIAARAEVRCPIQMVLTYGAIVIVAGVRPYRPSLNDGNGAGVLSSTRWLAPIRAANW